MISIDSKALLALRGACRQLGEDEVTVATTSGVITFSFSEMHEIRAQEVPYEAQPTRQQLTAILGAPSLPFFPSVP